MIGTVNYILFSDKIYEEEIVTKSGFKLFLSYESGTLGTLTRGGKIVGLKQGNPLGLKKGDIAICHWNIFKEVIDYNYVTNPSPFCFDQVNHLYYVPEDLIYGVIRDGEFVAVGEYCFVKPDISYKPEKMESGLIIPETARKNVNQVSGTLKYGSPLLEERGIQAGDKVYFTEDSDIIFNIKGEELYRMHSDWIIAYERA